VALILVLVIISQVYFVDFAPNAFGLVEQLFTTHITYLYTALCLAIAYVPSLAVGGWAELWHPSPVQLVVQQDAAEAEAEAKARAMGSCAEESEAEKHAFKFPKAAATAALLGQPGAGSPRSDESAPASTGSTPPAGAVVAAGVQAPVKAPTPPLHGNDPAGHGHGFAVDPQHSPLLMRTRSPSPRARANNGAGGVLLSSSAANTPALSPLAQSRSDRAPAMPAMRL
jgi:hypothetical protein